MQLTDRHIAKIDPLLQEALMQATGDELMRAIAVLNTDNVAIAATLDPAAYSSRLIYREALIAQRQTQLQAALGETMRSLQDLDLKTDGGSISPILVVEGTAKQVLAALELAGVRHISLEQLISLPEIVPAASIKHLVKIYLECLAGEPDRRTKELIYQSAQQYILNYHKLYGKLKILGMRESVELESIYTAVQCFDRWTEHDFLSVENSEQSFRTRQVHRFGTTDGVEVAHQEKYLMVLGAPGSGKSTFLRKLGLIALKGEFDYIPILLELKNFNDRDDLTKVISEQFRRCNFPKIDEFMETAFDKGKLLILLDGLDEVPAQNLDWTVEQIQKITETRSQNRFIISCRIAAYRHQFSQFKEAIIVEFSDNQIQQFIQNWFQSEQDRMIKTAQKCWELLQKPEYKGAKELARTPLLLTFLCLYYDSRQGFTNNRSLLYKDALHILLDQWLREKRVERGAILQDLTIPLEENLLTAIAYHGFQHDQLFFTRQELLDQIQTNLDNNVNASKHLNPADILRAIEVEQGLLMERSKNVYSFSHLTLQEYLTAQYIVDHNEIATFVTDHLTNSRWQEVFTLVAGLMRGGADDLLLAMVSQTQQMIDSPKLLGLLTWAHQVTDASEGNFKPAAKRVTVIFIARDLALDRDFDLTRFRDRERYLALALALGEDYLALALEGERYIGRDHAIEIDLTRELATARYRKSARELDRVRERHLFLDRARDLEKIKIYKNVDFIGLIARLESMKSQVPNRQASLQTKLEFAEKILQTWCQATLLNRDLLRLSEAETHALNDYFYANRLMIQCKNAAVRVSPQVWQTIEDRMMMPTSPV
jgi:energy-coupling factor transporter ATP-binding protein EcfA2